MNINEAYVYVMEMIDDIEKEGIKVTKVWPRSATKPDFIEEYGNREDRLSPDLWRHVTFYPKTNEEHEFIFEKAKSLGWLKIGFDTGCGCGGRDWEIDWSFHIMEGEDVADREEAMNAVEDLANQEGILCDEAKDDEA